MKKEIGWLLKEKYGNKPTENFYKDVKRLQASEPVDYVIGFIEFLGCKIDLSKKPLIPRPETEFWVSQAIAVIKGDAKSVIRCLDLFSGSGCVGVSILKNDPRVLCDMADSQIKCLKQVEINCQINSINKAKYRIIRSDVFLKIKGKYDYIFANPPYVAAKKIYNVQKSVLEFEPKTALFGGLDGLYYIKKFLSQAKKRLNPNGKIFMEFSPEQKKEIEKIVIKNKYKNCEFKKDQHGKWRWVVIK